MSKPEQTREEAIRRLNERASSLEQRTTPDAQAAAGHAVAAQAWRIIADLLGGVFVGLALGIVADWSFGTAPIGIITGVLGGFAISVWMAHRTAQRLMREAGPPLADAPSVPIIEDGKEQE